MPIDILGCTRATMEFIESNIIEIKGSFKIFYLEYGILFLPILKSGGNLLKGVHDWD